ncbi:hypothetical protein MIR68_000620 [Amoeboaphelidium protococcarum]|nr:hypothetical protein MIR68_000620 [Amoeboaphelidium protococcarum]
MPAYHSQFVEDQQFKMVGNMCILPFRTKVRGPAPPFSSNDPNDEDIVEEGLNLYRANCFYKNFEVKNGSDRLLIYVLLYIGECLTKIASLSTKGDQWPSVNEAQKHLTTLSTNANLVSMLPSDASFPLSGMYEKPTNKNDIDFLRSYLTQLRGEIGTRLIERIYVNGKPSKWWMCFQKRKFMGKSLS